MIHLGLIFFFLSITYTVKPTFPAAFRYTGQSNAIMGKQQAISFHFSSDTFSLPESIFGIYSYCAFSTAHMSYFIPVL